MFYKKIFLGIKTIYKDYEYQNEIIFRELRNKNFYTLNVISYNKMSINKKNKTITTIFFISNITCNNRTN